MDSKRTPARGPLRCAPALAALLVGTLISACDEEVTVAPPEPAPQIETTRSYSKGPKGLPNGDVYAMLVLSNGEFWIGTEQGIARYPSVDAGERIAGPDGVFNEINALPNPRVRDIVEFGGKVYVATFGGGIGIYDPVGGTWTSRGVANGMRNGSVTDMDVSITESRIYLGTTDGVSIYHPASDSFTNFFDDPNTTIRELTRPVVSAVAVRDTPAGVERWYAPRVESVEDISQGPLPPVGITVSRGASTLFTYTTTNSGLPEPNVTSIYHDDAAGPDVLWVGTGTSGVAKVEVGARRWTTYRTVHGLPSNTVYSITRANNTIWVATQDGLARQKSNGTWQGYNTSGGLSSDRVRRVFSDDGERLWIGYVVDGAARVKPTSAQ